MKKKYGVRLILDFDNWNRVTRLKLIEDDDSYVIIQLFLIIPNIVFECDEQDIPKIEEELRESFSYFKKQFQIYDDRIFIYCKGFETVIRREDDNFYDFSIEGGNFKHLNFEEVLSLIKNEVTDCIGSKFELFEVTEVEKIIKPINPDRDYFYNKSDKYFLASAMNNTEELSFIFRNFLHEIKSDMALITSKERFYRINRLYKELKWDIKELKNKEEMKKLQNR